MKLIKILNQFGSYKNLNQQLEKYTKNNQTKLAGDIFELVVKLFLQTNPKYKSKLKNVWLLKEVDKKIKQKLNLPDKDEGIDLIAETFDKRYWAIQAKYRSNPKETLTLSGSGGLATFNSLAFSYCKNISHGLICTTVDKPPKKIRLLKSVGFETLESWLALDDNNQEGWKHLVAKSKGKIIKPKPFKPRPHQVKAIQKSINYFKKNDRGKIIMPCGTGKSLAAFGKKPFLSINHLEGHALSPGIENKISFPYLLLLVSGGHSQYLIVKDLNNYKQIGTTIDDAVGEAFDKTAKILDLGYPGGPNVEKFSKLGNKNSYSLPEPIINRVLTVFVLSAFGWIMS